MFSKPAFTKPTESGTNHAGWVAGLSRMYGIVTERRETRSVIAASTPRRLAHRYRGSTLVSRSTGTLESLAGNSDAELDRIVRHEICHALVNEMRMFGPVTMSADEADRAMKHEERTVTALASVLLWCFQSGQKAKPKRKK